MVLGSQTFWAFNALHFSIFMAYQSGMMQESQIKYSFSYLNHEYVELISHMTTFVQVFYTNAAYNHYCRVYRSVIGSFNDLQNYILLNRLILMSPGPQKSVDSFELFQPYFRLSSRLATLGLMVFYVQLMNEGRIPERHWQQLAHLGLITPEEKRFLAMSSTHCVHSHCIDWAGQVLMKAFKQRKLPWGMSHHIFKYSIHLTMQLSQVDEEVRMYIPYQYFHLVNAMVLINLFAFAYRIGATLSFFAPIVYFVVSGILLGLLGLSAKLSDPLGKGSDLPLDEWLAECLSVTRDIVEMPLNHTTDGWARALAEEKPMPWGFRPVSEGPGKEWTAQAKAAAEAEDAEIEAAREHGDIPCPSYPVTTRMEVQSCNIPHVKEVFKETTAGSLQWGYTRIADRDSSRTLITPRLHQEPTT
eukprot:TRINITY_DN48616_c0_g1_i3.p1 TRINITY_DN48616_c0_g1~~TRINITY_DN48616_c0_g1_i3.p1  ORF type:complete len:415 (+),score=69.14 TRINITY_DN48616_c0_g1_i3:372-1616(+)